MILCYKTVSGTTIIKNMPSTPRTHTHTQTVRKQLISLKKRYVRVCVWLKICAGFILKCSNKTTKIFSVPNFPRKLKILLDDFHPYIVICCIILTYLKTTRMITSTNKEASKCETYNFIFNYFEKSTHTYTVY